MPKFIKNLLNKKHGVAAIEFALVAPLLFFLLFGILEFGIAILSDSTLDNALRNTARLGMVDPITSPTAIRASMQNYMQGLYKNDMNIVMCSAPNISSLNVLAANPSLIFTGSVPGLTCGAITAAAQSNTVMIYAAEYNLGAITFMMEPFIPDKLYAITIFRSEYLP